MPSSSRKPSTFSPPCQPPAYWPRAVERAEVLGSVTAASTFSFSARRSLRVERDGLLHGGERHQLQQVVLDDVARGADAVVVAGAAAHADVFGHRDLHVVDVVARSRSARTAGWRSAAPGCSGPSPCRGSGRCGSIAVRRERRASSTSLSSRADCEVVTERLLDHHPPPAVGLVGGVVRRGPTRFSCSRHERERLRRDRQVERVVAHRAAVAVEPRQGLG